MDKHEERVEDLGSHVAQALGFEGHPLRVIEFSCAFHDVGKIIIPHEIIDKSGPLTDNEYSVIKAHSVAGERVMDALGRHEIAPLIRSHHERWDGDGYPDGLKGEKIPFESRIIAVVDAFDAMTTDRPYREMISVHEAMDEIHRCRMTQFDPEISYALKMVLGYT